MPAIFVVTNIFFIHSLDNLIKFSNGEYLYKKYNDNDLKKYVEDKYKGFVAPYLIIAFILIGELIFCVIGLFHPIWVITIIIIFYDLFIFLYRKIKPLKISTIIKRASLGNFQSSNIKFQRILKLNELKVVKTNGWTLYIFPIVKIILWISIIVLQYNYNYFV